MPTKRDGLFKSFWPTYERIQKIVTNTPYAEGNGGLELGTTRAYDVRAVDTVGSGWH